jgi:hypothetical protein
MPVLIETLLLTLLLSLSTPDGRTDRYAPCLPKGTALDEVVVSTAQPKPSAGGITRNLTIKEKLRQLKAHCKKGKLVDRAGREIRFYRLIGCWGNPPEDYQEQLTRQNLEVQRLKKKYTVVEISCGPIDPRQVH